MMSLSVLFYNYLFFVFFFTKICADIYVFLGSGCAATTNPFFLT